MTPPTTSPATTGSADFRFSCPSCQQHLACENNQRGTSIVCPSCRAEILIPGQLGLAAHAPTGAHGVGNYSQPVAPGQPLRIRVKSA